MPSGPTDHRGRSVRLHMRARSRAARRELETVPYDTLVRIEHRRREIQKSPPHLVTLATLIAAYLGAVALWNLMLLLMPVEAAALVVGIGVTLLLIIGVVWLCGGKRQRENLAMIGAYLSERRCPACGYDLTGCEPADDACTVCPECGTAWKLTATPTKQ